MKRIAKDGLRREQFFALTRIGLRNFRGFRSLKETTLAPITFVVGQNSSGKSSLLDAILFFAQSGAFPTNELRLRPEWIGRLVDLGSYRDTVYRHAINLPMTITVGVKVAAFERGSSNITKNDDIDVNVSSTFVASKADTSSGRLKKITLSDPLTGAALSFRFTAGKNVRTTVQIGKSKNVWRDPSITMHHIFHWTSRNFYRLLTQSPKESRRGKSSGFRQLKRAIESNYYFNNLFQSIQRVKSGRDAPQRSYPISGPTAPYLGRPFGSAVGAVTPADVEVAMTKKGPRSLIFDPRGEYTRQNLDREKSRIVRSLRRMNIARRIVSRTLSPYHKAVHIADSKTGVDANLIDVGFGASQVLPVLFEASKFNLSPLFVEQPEIHLHPRAQGEVADFLLDTAAFRQIFIETHSVHLINRARIRILNGELQPSDVTILYVEKKHDGSHITEIGIDANGEFTTAWPIGFFDERYEDTMKIMALREKKSHGSNT